MKKVTYDNYDVYQLLDLNSYDVMLFDVHDVFSMTILHSAANDDSSGEKTTMFTSHLCLCKHHHFLNHNDCSCCLKTNLQQLIGHWFLFQSHGGNLNSDDNGLVYVSGGHWGIVLLLIQSWTNVGSFE